MQKNEVLKEALDGSTDGKSREGLRGDAARIYDIQRTKELVLDVVVPTRAPKGSKDAKDQRRSEARAALVEKLRDPTRKP